MRESQRRRRVHHRSVVAGFNQLLTPCRLAAVPTNDATMLSLSRAPPPTSGNDGEGGNDRVINREER